MDNDFASVYEYMHRKRNYTMICPDRECQKINLEKLLNRVDPGEDITLIKSLVSILYSGSLLNN